jgi:ubiquinone/menaquinone biosynthesis C-methylase UbiE
MKQKEVFLNSEGDAWFKRNRQSLSAIKLPDDDPISREILDLFVFNQLDTNSKILEIGCGDGRRLAWIEETYGAKCFGIEPSNEAVAAAKNRGLSVSQGSADSLPFEDKFFDLVIFGFCLYLCDRDDLFRIASEADRVLRAPGWLVIQDFYSPSPLVKDYHHKDGVKSYKMNYSTLFTWHPDYECLLRKVQAHGDQGYTDDVNEWVSIFMIRKHSASILK